MYTQIRIHTRGNRLQCPVACGVAGQVALPNPSGTGKDLPYMRNQRDRATGNELRFVSCHQDGGYACSFTQFFVRTCFTLATSSRWYCPDDSDVNAECHHTCVGSSQRVRPVKPYFSVKCDYSRSGPFRGEHDKFLAVEFWRVNNRGLCASHLVILLSRWLLRHDTLCIWKSKKKPILNHNWYDVI